MNKFFATSLQFVSVENDTITIGDFDSGATLTFAFNGEAAQLVARFEEGAEDDELCILIADFVFNNEPISENWTF